MELLRRRAGRFRRHGQPRPGPGPGRPARRWTSFAVLGRCATGPAMTTTRLRELPGATAHVLGWWLAEDLEALREAMPVEHKDFLSSCPGSSRHRGTSSSTAACRTSCGRPPRSRSKALRSRRGIGSCWSRPRLEDGQALGGRISGLAGGRPEAVRVAPGPIRARSRSPATSGSAKPEVNDVRIRLDTSGG